LYRHTNTTLATLNAKPAPLAIDLARTAVLVIDMQNDFGAIGGMFERAGLDISAIRATIGPTSRVLDAVRSRKIPVVYIAEALSADHSDIGPSHSPTAGWRSEWGSSDHEAAMERISRHNP
jgi:ureidoacrylate peracid hydrolase